jgi:transmembrane sensor
MTMKQGMSRQGMTPTERACYWIVRHDSDDMTAAERAGFDVWLAEPANVVAFREACRLKDLLAGAEDDPHLRAMRRAALALRPPRHSWRGVRVVALAATLLLVIGTAAMLPQARISGAWLMAQVSALLPPRLEATRYATRVGERLEVALPDGSGITLNTDTILETIFTATGRAVRLERGQAYFSVARDPSRPFVVTTAAGVVTAVGTAFDVLLAADRFQVLVEEGKVSIVPVAEREQEASRGAGPAVKSLPVGKGQRFLAVPGNLPSIAEIDVARQLRWRTGFVEFDDVTLAEAVRELNRYSNHVVQLRDERVAALRISGVFRVGQIDRFLDVTGELLPIEISRPLGAPIMVGLKSAASSGGPEQQAVR